MSVTIGGIACDELFRDYEEGVNARGPYGSKAYLCDWANRYAVANAMLGLSSYSGGAVSFTAPMPHPETPRMYVQDVALAGVGKPGAGTGNIRYEKAVVVARFGVSEFGAIIPGDLPAQLNIDPATPFIYAEQTLEDSVEWKTIPGKKVKVTGGLPLTQDLAFPIHDVVMNITLHRLPFMPVNTARLKNRVNSGTFLGCPEGHVMFNGCRTQRAWFSDGSESQDMHLGFTYRIDHEWNETPNPYANGWVLMQDDEGNDIFPYADLSVIFPTAYVA
jgi:hypothetical protein